MELIKLHLIQFPGAHERGGTHKDEKPMREGVATE